MTEATKDTEVPAATEEVKEQIYTKREADESSPHFGLLNTIPYLRDEFGMIDWRHIIPKSFLFVNSQKFKENNKEAPKSIDGLEDSQIIIKLGGIKWLARVRGYEKVAFEILQTAPNVTVKCIIDWVPNFENPLGATYEEIASCNSKNASEFNLVYAESIAANRAFVRCVRNFLNVNIVGEEEIFDKEVDAPKTEPQNTQDSSVSINPQSIFIKIAKEKGLAIEAIIKLCSDADETIKDAVPEVKTEQELLKVLTPKTAKKLIKSIKKS